LPKRDRIICFGDIIDDVVAIPHGVIRPDTDTASAIRFLPGGSPANTAAWLASLGAPVDFVGCVGRADLARHTEQLPGVGVHLTGHPSLTTGVIVVLVQGQTRTMLTDRGANAALDPVMVTDEMLERAVVLHLTGHALLNDAGERGFRRLMERATAAGVDISIAPGSAGFISDYGVAAFRDVLAPASILFPSLDEGRLLTGLSDPQAIAAKLAKRIPTVVLTLGTEGAIVATSDGTFAIPAISAEVVDPTGAGDAFCAGFLAEWVGSGDALTSARRGARVAARSVTSIGARPQS
jgi:sugar/nucleoside kinase (ribokinase family)